MLNDVSFPPVDDEHSSDDLKLNVPPDHRRDRLTHPVIPGPDKTVADVQLFDHPDMEPGGFGNFWSLGLLGILLLGFAVMVGWVIL